MKSKVIGGLAILAGVPLASALKEIANPAKQEKFTSGAVMDSIMERKTVSSLPGARNALHNTLTMLTVCPPPLPLF